MTFLPIAIFKKCSSRKPIQYERADTIVMILSQANQPKNLIDKISLFQKLKWFIPIKLNSTVKYRYRLNYWVALKIGLQAIIRHSDALFSYVPKS